uniref:ANK_REP_REGION domain-containing protein n=1 Tax=Brugia timori TaxID=42155 RepID=A0A0R3QK82_9BILA
LLILQEFVIADQLSLLDTESDDEIKPYTGGAHAYFVSDEMVYSIYRCILLKNEVISRNLFNRPLDCVILLLSAGHFCGGIFENNKLLVHKSFHRYVIRAKQGTSQSVSDARGSAAKSAGASVRRYNEKALKEEIQCLLANWSKLLEQSPLIFVRCPMSLRHVFFEETKNFKLQKDDERLRTIPFETRRPTVDELQRTWSRLSMFPGLFSPPRLFSPLFFFFSALAVQIFEILFKEIIRSHGSVVNFNEEQERLKKLRKKQKRLFRRKVSGVNYPSSESLESDSDNATAEMNQQQPEVVMNISNQRKQNSEQCEAVVNVLSDVNVQALYASIRLNSVSKLHQLLESNEESKEEFLKYIREVRFPPTSSTFLHVVARRGAVEIMEELLLLGCDPAVKDSDGKVPYQVAQNRAVRQAFSKFRSRHPDAFNWNVSQIPELAVLSEEQLAKEAEKKRIQREKKKQRDKVKRIVKHQEKIEQEQRQKYLALSDREKRALAAERRLAASLQEGCQIVENDGSRCFKCGVVLIPKHFEYCDNRFCSLACLQQHRREHPPQLIS